MFFFFFFVYKLFRLILNIVYFVWIYSYAKKGWFFFFGVGGGVGGGVGKFIVAPMNY